MTEKNLDHYKELLNCQLEDLLLEAGKTVVGMVGTDDEHFPDPTDRASLESDRNFLLRVKDRERKLILKVQEALARIDEDEFGECELCGEPISEERLEVRPVTTYCVACKTEEEEQEKQRRNK